MTDMPPPEMSLRDMPVRDAATIVLLRQGAAGPSVLMGQRGAGAAFMPNKYVFPGGAVDAADARVPLARPLDRATHAALSVKSITPPNMLAVAALRELAEETGQIIACPGDGCDWPGFRNLSPDASALRFVFRAITPPGRPRRFDARFFLAPVEALLHPEPTAGSGELDEIAWLPLAEARALDLPAITRFVLGEISERQQTPNRPLPFVRMVRGRHIVEHVA